MKQHDAWRDEYMRLINVTIHKYKSFLTEQSFSVDQITRIVGKNESGKTALLEALAKTNYFEDNKDFTFDMTLDYPRNSLVRNQNKDQYAITCEYELSDDDIHGIESEFAQGIITDKAFSVTTNYDNTQSFDEIKVSLAVFKTWLLEEAAVDEEDQRLITGAESFTSIEKLITQIDVSSALDSIKETIRDINKSGSVEDYIYNTHIEGKLPKYWYFSDYFSLPSRINLNGFASRELGRNSGELTDEEYKIAKALFELSGLRIEDVQSENDYEAFKAQLEATSNSITDDMFEYWTTNPNLEIRFEIEHQNGVRYLNIRIYNSKHRVTLPLKNRSKGFLWFFSFLVWFSKIQGDDNSDYILLLDEPGLSLHASAQHDLLRFIEEKLAPKYQVIYTTHSPFMIDSLKLNEVRTVYDTQDAKRGSVISDAVEEKDSDTLFPLQAALGYTIAQNLYVSPKNLLVEGISDLVYLNHFSTILKECGREGLSDDITIVPVGGADKIATFISLMRGNDLSTVCLLDTFTDQKAEAHLKRMVEQNIIGDKNILFYSAVLERSYADIEDLFNKREYLELYNGAFNQSIQINDINDSRPILSQLKKLNGNKAFNHYMPANYMAKNIASVEFSEETLSRFENLFKIINEKLSVN